MLILGRLYVLYMKCEVICCVKLTVSLAWRKSPSTRWLTEEMSLHFPFAIDTITAGALMS